MRERYRTIRACVLDSWVSKRGAWAKQFCIFFGFASGPERVFKKHETDDKSARDEGMVGPALRGYEGLTYFIPVQAPVVNVGRDACLQRPFSHPHRATVHILCPRTHQPPALRCASSPRRREMQDYRSRTRTPRPTRESVAAAVISCSLPLVTNHAPVHQAFKHILTR